MFELNFPLAFLGGLVSFFAPCVLPLLPAYVGFVTGVSTYQLKKKGYSFFRKRMTFSSFLYILGFSFVFVLLGTAAAGVGSTLRRYDFIIQKVGGIIILVLGLEFAGIIKLPLLARTKRFSLPSWANKVGEGRAFLVGVIFATAWTPCIGPVLGSILALAAVSGTAAHGAALLFVYSLGISLPFMLVSLTLASAPKYLSFINKHVGVIARVSGLILAALGILLITNTYRFVNSWLFEVAFRLGYEIK